MQIVIRKARPRDIRLLAPMWRDLTHYHTNLAAGNPARKEFTTMVRNAESLWRKWILKWIRSPDGLVLMAEDGGKPVGYSFNYVKKSNPVYRVNKLGCMSELYIVPGYRKKGISSRFKNEAFKWFRKKGLKHVCIGAHGSNKRALGIYRKWGFFDFSVDLRKKI